MSKEFYHYIVKDLECIVRFDYTPAQRLIINPPDIAQEGFDASVEITEVIVLGEDILECLNEACIDELISAAWDWMNERDY